MKKISQRNLETMIFVSLLQSIFRLLSVNNKNLYTSCHIFVLINFFTQLRRAYILFSTTLVFASFVVDMFEIFCIVVQCFQSLSLFPSFFPSFLFSETCAIVRFVHEIIQSKAILPVGQCCPMSFVVCCRVACNKRSFAEG